MVELVRANSHVKNTSTVDYVICSVLMLKLFENFYIRDFCNLYSDVHCPITFVVALKFRRLIRDSSSKYEIQNTFPSDVLIVIALLLFHNSSI